jgi:Methyltransferase domain
MLHSSPPGSPRPRASSLRLEPHPLGRDGLPWYAQHALRCLPAQIDVLLVDGPPAFEPGAGLSRYPALPAFAERLTPDAVVVLDDIDRRGELGVLHAWEHDTDFRFELRTAERIAHGQRSPPPPT